MLVALRPDRSLVRSGTPERVPFGLRAAAAHSCICSLPHESLVVNAVFHDFAVALRRGNGAARATICQRTGETKMVIGRLKEVEHGWEARNFGRAYPRSFPCHTHQRDGKLQGRPNFGDVHPHQLRTGARRSPYSQLRRRSRSAIG